MSDSEVMELALIENLQREDLNPLEEAQGYQSLMETYGMTQEEVSKTVGKSRPTVANALRLLNLPQQVLDLVQSGSLSAGHARTLLSFQNPEEMLKAAKMAVEQGISVRELEKMSKKANEQPVTRHLREKKRIPYFSEVELALNEHLGRKVQVTGTKKRGVLQICLLYTSPSPRDRG